MGETWPIELGYPLSWDNSAEIRPGLSSGGPLRQVAYASESGGFQKGNAAMQSVKVRKSGISAENAAEVIQRGLGEGYQVQPDGGAEVLVRKGMFGRAKVRLREEAGGTVFEVTGV